MFKIPFAMKSKILGLRISGTIFGFVALIHLLRIITGFTVMIDEFTLPVWINWMGFAATAALCLWLWKLSK
jgi:hypothetical protein